MSNLEARRNSPRRRVGTSNLNISMRVVIILYAWVPLIGFLATGHWLALGLTLAMLKFGFRPLKHGGAA